MTTTTGAQDLGPNEAAGPDPEPRRTVGSGSGFSTAEIKARIEAMFRDRPRAT
ncbi:hypothetical protein [Rhodococcus phenolicus]|uniref:hypothetical protein n=1 Tax=Rhodococcus phenolicus TaxID=263849 RepID=UPI000B2EB08F|nr:hypothetical protein [Rhodococcus phenolicus]